MTEASGRETPTPALPQTPLRGAAETNRAELVRFLQDDQLAREVLRAFPGGTVPGAVPALATTPRGFSISSTMKSSCAKRRANRPSRRSIDAASLNMATAWNDYSSCTGCSSWIRRRASPFRSTRKRKPMRGGAAICPDMLAATRSWRSWVEAAWIVTRRASWPSSGRWP